MRKLLCYRSSPPPALNGHRRSRWLPLILVVPLVVACSSTAGFRGTTAGLLRAHVARAAAHPSSASASKLAVAEQAFGFDLYRQLRAADRQPNVVVSPYSAHLALSMLTQGAAGPTAAELLSALGAPGSSAATLAAGWNDLVAGLDAAAANGDLQFHTADGLWLQQGSDVRPPFLDTLARQFGSGVWRQDFRGDPEGSRQAVNGWVSQQTHQRIKDLLPQGSIDDATRFVLANAVYLKAAWQTPFDPGSTEPGPFHRDGGRTATVDFMHNELTVPALTSPDLDAVALPYKGGRFQALVLAPRVGALDQLERSLTPSRLAGIVGGLQDTPVDLALPKFELRSDGRLDAALRALGVARVFDPRQADLSGIDGRRDLYVSLVQQQAWIKVAEKGTEAAAATGVVGKATAVQGPEPTRITVDRPFLFLVRDAQTGTILFLSRVGDPSAR